MRSRSKSQPYIDDRDNISFIDLVKRIFDFDITQAELADRLGISPGQLSRIKKGERHAAKQHIKELRTFLRELRDEHNRREKETAPNLAGRSLFSIDHGVLRRLSAQESVEAFRDLLWARAAARGVPITVVNISSRVTERDGGVDASISENDHPVLENDELLGTGTRFQIKTGDFAPWQEAEIHKELFGSKSPSFENLGSAVQEMLREGKRYVLACFGRDPSDRQLRLARRLLRGAFENCGYENANVDVWGQTHLIGLFRDYPSLCLRLRGHMQDGFRSHLLWSQDAEMQPAALYGPEQELLIEELRSELRTGKVGHLRLIGEPGIGKTRLALEITQTDDMSPLTLYVRDGRTLLESSFINELIQSDDHRFVVFVVDECPTKDSTEIWNSLKPKCDRIRLITIDHGPDESADDKTRIEIIDGLGNEEIVAILRSYEIDEDDAKRWTEFCERCPRVAHVLGDNLRMNREDLLQPPGIVDVWNRFIVGHDDPHSTKVEHRKLVLLHLSLFERFGYEPPVQNEAKFIAGLLQETLTWPEFQSIVCTLRQRRILQGAKTLYITPRLLQIHLFCQFWETYGSSFDIAQLLVTMPHELWNWFASTFRFGHNSEPVKRALEKLLPNESLFRTGEFPEDRYCGRLLNVLSEATPKSVLRCLQRTIGKMNLVQLRSLDAPRQDIVWALEKIAVWEDCFVGAAHLLLRLAESENRTTESSSVRTFCQLFSLIPSLATTQTAPERRLIVLRDALSSPTLEQRRLGLEACACALDTSLSFRVVGPEHQGLRKKIEFWMPKTYGQLWEAHRQVWQLLTEKLESWSGEDRKALIETITESFASAIHIPPLAENVLRTLKAIATDPASDVGAISAFIKRHLRNKESKLPDDVKEQLRQLDESLEGNDFPSQVRRFVKFATGEDCFDDDHKRSTYLDKKFDKLAEEAVSDPELLRKELGWLVCENSNPVYSFGFRISNRDTDLDLLGHVLAAYAAHGEHARPSFLSGYLAAIFRRDADRWESIVLDLADHATIASMFSDCVIGSGMSERVAKEVIVQCKSGVQSKERLERWWFDPQLQALSIDVVNELIELQLEDGTGQTWCNAVQMCHSYLLEKNNEKPLPEELVFRLLTHELMGDGRVAHRAAYYWSGLAKAFRLQYPNRTWDLFRGVLSSGVRDWLALGDLNSYGDSVLTEIVREDPTTAFQCIAEIFDETDSARSYALRRFLSDSGHRTLEDDSPGPIQHIAAKTLVEWVDDDVEERGGWLAAILPKTLDESVAGRLTRDFIAKYGNYESISSSLYCSFHSRGWCGNASDHYRKLRDEARGWLVDEDDSTVIRWVEDYIDSLSAYIERAETEEEREF